MLLNVPETLIKEHHSTSFPPQLFTEVLPYDVTATVIHAVTIIATNTVGVTSTSTTTMYTAAHQEVYQTTPTVVTNIEVIPTCTSEVTTPSRPSAMTSSVDVIVTRVATATLFTTPASTTTLTLKRTREPDWRGAAFDEVKRVFEEL